MHNAQGLAWHGRGQLHVLALVTSSSGSVHAGIAPPTALCRSELNSVSPAEPWWASWTYWGLGINVYMQVYKSTRLLLPVPRYTYARSKMNGYIRYSTRGHGKTLQYLSARKTFIGSTVPYCSVLPSAIRACSKNCLHCVLCSLHSVLCSSHSALYGNIAENPDPILEGFQILFPNTSSFHDFQIILYYFFFYIPLHPHSLSIAISKVIYH